MISIAEETATSPAPATEGKPKAAKKASHAPQGAKVAKKRAKSPKKASSAKKTPKAAPKATPKPKAARPGSAKEKGAREGSKTAEVLDLLKRPGGVTAKELLKATGWQAHSVRGFLSGTVGKKMGLTISSIKSKDGERTYSIKG